MKKFKLIVPYVAYQYIEVEAETSEEAINKAFEKELIGEEISLCWHCSREVGEFFVDDDHIVATEISE